MLDETGQPVALPAGQVALTYVLDAVLAWILVKWVARTGDPSRYPWLRGALYALVLVGNAAVLLWIDCSPRAVAFIAVLVALTSPLLPNGPTRILGEALGRYRFPAYVLSVATVAALSHVYLPITTFLTSPGEIGIHLRSLLEGNASHAMVVVYLASALYAFAPSPRVKTLFAAALLAAVPVALVYAYVFPFGYPVMNGLMFEQIPVGAGQVAIRLLVDAVAVSGLALGTMWAAHRLGGGRVVAALLLTNISLATAAGVSVARDRTRDSQAGSERALERPIRFSREKPNVLIVFLDRFMGGFVERILADQPDLLDELDGFTWYPRTVAAGENSISGLHPLLGGYDYTPREMNGRGRPLRELSVEAYSILPVNFGRKGWATNFVNPAGLGFTMDGDCSVLSAPGLECTHVPMSVTRKRAEERGVPLQVLAESNYADLLELLGLMRVAPYSVRAVIQQKGPWRPFLDHSAGTTFREWAELTSWPELSRADSDRSNLNIVFNILPHEPYFLGDDCLPRPRRFYLPDEEIRRRGFGNLFEYQHYVTSGCALRIVSRYFRWMREQGVYDDTKIVIVSDHGIVGPVADRSSRAVEGRTQENVFVRTRSVLLVKPRGAWGRLAVSEEFLPNAEVPRIVCEEIGGCTNPYLGERPIATLGRDAPWFVSFVPWQFNLQEPTAFRVFREMALVNRDPYDREGWREVKTKPAPVR